MADFTALRGRILAWGDIESVVQGALEGDFNRAIDTGSANSVALSYPNYGTSTLEDGQLFRFRSGASNTGTTSVTISLAGATGVTKDLRIYRQGNSRDLCFNELQSGNDYLIAYRADVDRFFLLNPSTPSKLVYLAERTSLVSHNSTGLVDISGMTLTAFIPEKSLIRIDYMVAISVSGTAGNVATVLVSRGGTAIADNADRGFFKGYHNDLTGRESTIFGYANDETLTIPDGGTSVNYSLQWNVSAGTVYSLASRFTVEITPQGAIL